MTCFSFAATYLASILLLQTVAVFLTVFFLDIYFRSVHKPVPGWVQTVVSRCLSKLVCIDCQWSRGRVTPIQEQDSSASNADNYIVNDKGYMSSENALDCNVDVDDDVKDKMVAQSGKTKKESSHQYSWKEIALMLDRLTMYVYFVLVTIFTSLTFGVMIANYGKHYNKRE